MNNKSLIGIGVYIIMGACSSGLSSDQDRWLEAKITEPTLAIGGARFRLPMTGQDSLLVTANCIRLLAARGKMQYEVIKTVSKRDTLSIYLPELDDYELHMPDSTRVWLGSGASLRVPLLRDKEKRLLLTGDAFFSVAATPAPVLVQVGVCTISSAMAKFVVRTEGDSINITAIKDSLWITGGNVTLQLEPGQMVSVPKLTADTTKVITGIRKTKTEKLSALIAQKLPDHPTCFIYKDSATAQIPVPEMLLVGRRFPSLVWTLVEVCGIWCATNRAQDTAYLSLPGYKQAHKPKDSP